MVTDTSVLSAEGGMSAKDQTLTKLISKSYNKLGLLRKDRRQLSMLTKESKNG